MPMGAGIGGVRLRGARASSAVSPPSGPTPTSARMGTDVGGIVAGRPRGEMDRDGGGKPWAPAPVVPTGGSRRRASIEDLTSDRLNLIVTGTFQNADGDPRADDVAFFDGTAWHALGPTAPATARGRHRPLRSRSSTGRSTRQGASPAPAATPRRRSVASFALSQVIAYPTPTVTAGPSAAPTPTVVTAGPNAVATPTVTPSAPPPDVKPPATLLRGAKIDQAKRKATFRFASSEQGSKFTCKLDAQELQALHVAEDLQEAFAPGKHVFRVHGARPRRQRRSHADGQALPGSRSARRPGGSAGRRGRCARMRSVCAAIAGRDLGDPHDHLDHLGDVDVRRGRRRPPGRA